MELAYKIGRQETGRSGSHFFRYLSIHSTTVPYQ